jgi:CHAD domain-containing protein
LASTGPLRLELGRLSGQLEGALASLLSDPSPENIHRVRTLIRRIEAARRILPRRLQRRRRLARYLRSARRLFKATTPVSDLDIAATELELHALQNQPAVGQSVAAMRERRPALLVSVFDAAKELQSLRPPKIRRREATRSRLAKNRGRAARKLEDRLRENLPRIASDQRLLHSFRKDCKTLRYVLEIGSSSKAQRRRLKALRQWQDALGQITDIDAALRCISSNGLGRQLSEVTTSLRRLRTRKVNSLSSLPRF